MLAIQDCGPEFKSQEPSYKKMNVPVRVETRGRADGTFWMSSLTPSSLRDPVSKKEGGILIWDSPLYDVNTIG